MLGTDRSEYCLGCGGYCVGFLAGGDGWCCVALGNSFYFLLFILFVLRFGGVGCNIANAIFSLRLKNIDEHET